MNGCAHASPALLEPAERARQSRRLLLAMTAIGLLLLSAFWQGFVANGAALAQALAAAASLLLASPMLRAAWQSLRAPDLHGLTDLLAALAIVGAWAAGDWVSAALLPILIVLGHALEERSLLGSREAIAALAELSRHRSRRLLPQGGHEDVDNDLLTTGDQIDIRPGDRIPADGRVTEGHSSLDASAVTGEAAPGDVSPGSRVYAGSINLQGRLRMTVERAAADSALGRIIALMREAESAKPRITRFVERHASAYLAMVLAIAAISWFAGRDPQAALAVLVAACPCALVIAAPSVAVAGVAAAARHQILIRGSAFLEELGEVDSLVIDKTGTLTRGQLSVVHIDTQAQAGDTPSAALLAASLAAGSSHPVSRALAALMGASPPESLTDQQETQGMGLSAKHAVGRLALGKPDWLRRNGWIGDAPPARGAILAGLACDGRLLAWFHLADTPRPEAADTLRQLRALGLERQWLLTGDQAAAAEPLAAELGIAQVVSQALPDDKLAHVKAEIAAGRHPLVVGDGINDSLALKAGAVGVALGERGADIAVAAADVVITGDDLRRLATAVRLSRRCGAILRANVAIGLGWTLALTLLAAAGGLGASGAVIAAILHNGSTLAVMINSGRILRFHEE
ncbi:heavy metal translocating P-type ATPase [Chromobacterium sp. IIBBL 290-4]|uniref:heavy metal translocating P-type ATPase n=1 Tax=Chromobacterium sp. IIBBL 290-4 TaxID=2953890 RepID=UPI0020B7D574|nr:heavy metal translocating P-type ATPase [Chromobacterium sp. IIBBL 290-4]UTH74642.1 heavy metal translocating P-type ATPase [Chromobacterium sp. IIBBL 290-4]